MFIYIYISIYIYIYLYMYIYICSFFGPHSCTINPRLSIECVCVPPLDLRLNKEEGLILEIDNYILDNQN